jgi:glutathione reductase (NADPH)
MSPSYDLLVIGTGSAGSSVAMRLREAGWSVAIIDHRPYGGTCALRGCDPKKVLLGGASAVDHARRMHGKGVTGEAGLDWRELMAFKRSFTDPVPEQRESTYAKSGIRSYHGRARFVGPNSLEVGEVTIAARHILLACGAEPVRMDIPGEAHLLTSEGFLSLESLPPRLVLVGGGYIAAEVSHLAARAGTKVTVLQRGARLLPQFDADLVGWLMEAFYAHGITVHTRTTVQAVEKTQGAYRVRADSAGSMLEIDADAVVHAAGRAPDLATLNLEAAGIETEHGRLKLNDYLQSVSNPAVYAAGDAAQKGPPLTPVASHDAQVVAENLLEGNRRRPDYAGVPSVAFSLPPIAAVGLTEERARKQGLRFRASSQKASGWYTARQAAEPVYGFKILIEEETDRLLGAHLVGPNADEVINLFALAVRHGIKARELKTTLFAYPTGASDIGYML